MAVAEQAEQRAQHLDSSLQQERSVCAELRRSAHTLTEQLLNRKAAQDAAAVALGQKQSELDNALAQLRDSDVALKVLLQQGPSNAHRESLAKEDFESLLCNATRVPHDSLRSVGSLLCADTPGVC